MEKLHGNNNNGFERYNIQEPPPSYPNSEMLSVPFGNPSEQLHGSEQQSTNTSRDLQSQATSRTCYVVPVEEFYYTPKFVLFHVKAARGIGITQIVLGCLVFAFDLIASIIGSVNPYGVSLYTGVYSGLIFILAGAFGLTAANKKSKCYLVTSMIFSIISCGFVITCLTLLSIQINVNSDYEYYHRGQFYHYKNTAIVAFSSLALIASAVEGVIAIVQSSFACLDCCPCCKRGQFEKRCRSGQAQRPPLIKVQGVPPSPQLPHVMLQHQGNAPPTTFIVSNPGHTTSQRYLGSENNIPTVYFTNNNMGPYTA